MKYKRVLITGGCGFVGSSLALKLKSLHDDVEVYVVDNFIRKGSRLNVPRLEKEGIQVLEGDVRDREFLFSIIKPDLIIDCAAEPSVMAGSEGSPLTVTDINLGGTLNCLELARVSVADFVFLSTSRVYPVEPLLSLPLDEGHLRFNLKKDFAAKGISQMGITEDYDLCSNTTRTLYGSTKLCSEFLVQEFRSLYGVKAVINRFGVIAGPWQFGKVDQGIVSLWMSRHVYKKPLSYIGFGGTGKQVRDVLHVDDLFQALYVQLKDIDAHDGEVYNIGGGLENSVSLAEMTDLCQKITSNTVEISLQPETRRGDIPWYVTDYSKFSDSTGWKPQKTVADILKDTHDWITWHKDELNEFLN